jgi:pimeloyl-ACP methyl ester carboxylesterase
MFTERVTRLALIASRLRADTAQEAAARRSLADRIESEQSVEPVIDAYLPRLLAPRTYADRADVVARATAIAHQNTPAGMAGTLRGMALRSSSEDIAEDLDVPVLVIAGGADQVVSLDEARSIAEGFPRARLAVSGASGHLPTLEEPASVTETLAAWLSE